MEVPLEIRFQGMDPSPTIENRVRERVEKLNRYYDRLVSCRVGIEKPHANHQKGNICEVVIEMSVPGDELVVSHGPHRPQQKYKDPDLYTILNEAFDVAERQLKQFKDRRSP